MAKHILNQSIVISNTRGIVLKTIKYSETSVICTVYTEEYGLRKYIINGVRSAKAKIKPSLVQPMSMLEMVVFHRENQELNRLSELRPAYVFSKIPFEVMRGAIGLFMAEVAQKAIRESEPNPPLFEFLFDSFLALEQIQEGLNNLHLLYLAQLTGYLGFLPNGNADPETPYFDLKEGIFSPHSPAHANTIPAEESRLMDLLLYTEYPDAMNIPLDNGHRRLLLGHLLRYYAYHVENFGEVNAWNVLREVLS